MIRILSVDDIGQLVKKVSLKTFFHLLIEQMRGDFARWDEFQKSPRVATHVPGGIIELMPISDQSYYSFKYVNGHPNNTKLGKQTVIAIGQLSLIKTGYPILISEMTFLTALRTAAASALASQYLMKKETKTFGIIGTGAQSEFQTLAHHYACGIQDVYYFDTDPVAMKKFQNNLAPFGIQLHPCANGHIVVEKSDLITTATAQPGHQKVIVADWIAKGCHINKIGGDSPGKTELDPALLQKTKIVVEYYEQTKNEGEIQQSGKKPFAELWELVQGKKNGRENGQEITLFDSVGFALEDYSILRVVHDLAEKHNIGHSLALIPEPSNPKNLFEIFNH